jgi:fatty acid desaturase
MHDSLGGGIAAALSADRAAIRAVLTKHGLRIADFSRPSTAIACGYILICWLAIALAGSLWIKGGYARVPALAILALAQHALLMLTHEASHLSLFAGRSLNYRLGDLCCALPIGQTVRSYAVHHRPHHASLNTEGDTAFFITDPSKSPGRLAWIFVSFLLGRVIWDLALRAVHGSRVDGTRHAGSAQEVRLTERRRVLAVSGYHSAIVLVCLAFHSLDLWIAWTASTILLVPVLDAIRTVAEHRRGAGDTSDFHTRSHHLYPPLSWMFSPFFQFHWEHHLFPGLPHCRLGRLHRLLLETGLEGARPARGGIFGAFIRGLS